MNSRPVTFSIEKTLPRARGRAGVLQTPHGPLETPAFIAVATKATVKAVVPQALAELGLQSVIANTYHLYLEPGEDVVERAGGVGKFMGWHGPTMTDSGGFQVFSLGEGFGKKISKFTPDMASPEEGLALFDEDVASQHGKLAVVDDEGVTFTSHYDGSLHRFTPERSVEIQHKLGADIFFAFDQCTAPTSPYEFQKEAMERTHSWAKRSLTAHQQNTGASMRQGIYGIGQGGPFDDLRAHSARTIVEMGFDGFGLGGSFSRKYGEHSLESALATLTLLPDDMPVHGLGVGEPEDLFMGVEAGVDTFDCVAPTRMGRTGGLYTKQGKIAITNASYANDYSPIDEGCACHTCTTFTRSYLSHLFRTKEMLGATLASMHNLYFITSLLARIRSAILNGNFEQFRDDFVRVYRS